MSTQYEQFGKSFAEAYYTCFDNNRSQIGAMYHENALFSFEGAQLQGRAAIQNKIDSLSFKQIAHAVTCVDCQPTEDAGVLVVIIGQLKTDTDNPQSFSQSFYVKNVGGSYFIMHDIFRLIIHNI